MKKVLKVFFAILVFGCCVNKAGAVTLNVGDKAKKETVSRLNGLTIYMGDGNHMYWLTSYKFKISQNSITSYCLDPHLRAYGDGATENADYKVKRLLDPSIPYDAGLLEMIKIGKNDNNNTYNGVSDNNLLIATSIAVRAYHYGIFGYVVNDDTSNKYRYDNGTTYANAHISFGVAYAEEHISDVNLITHKNVTAGNWFKNLNLSSAGFSNSNKFFFGHKSLGLNVPSGYGNIEKATINVGNTAYKILDAGVKKAVEVAKNKGNMPSISSGQSSESSTDKDGEYYIYNNIVIKNFANDAIVKDVTYSCSNCQREGITIKSFEYKNIQNNKWERLTANVNVANQVETKNGYKSGNIQIRMLVEKEEKENCTGANYEINYKYTDSVSHSKLINDYNGAILEVDSADKNVSQRFAVISKNDGLTDGGGNNLLNGKVSGKINCQGPRPCATEVSLPICSSDKDKAVATVTAPENIKRCIINNKDEAGNSYQLSDGNGGISNPYCSVFCKEDYAKIQLNPIVENVACGGYFQLKSHVEGKKTCYTGSTNANKEIDKEQFLEDVKEAQEEVIKAYNEYAKWSAAAAITSTSTTLSNSAPGKSDTMDCGDDKASKCDNGCDGDSLEATGYSKEWSWYEFNNDGTKQREAKRDSYGPGTVDCGDCTCSDNSASNKDEEHKTNRNNALKTLNEKIEKYEKIIADYNGCTTAWTNTFKFDQRIKFYYDENHYIGNYTTYYDLLENAKDKDLFYLEKNGKVNEKTSIEICFGQTDNSYNCLGNSSILKAEDISSKNNSDNSNEDYNKNTNKVFKEETFIECTSSGCGEKKRNISQATFVKKTVEKKQDYITPTSYYQVDRYGRITVNKHYAGNALQLSAIKNGLPVSTKLVGGGLFRLMLEDFGEFYDSKEVGRIFDFKGDNEKKSIAYTKQENGIQTFDGNYKCNFYSNCRDERCPNCEYKCETPEDCGWRQCPDCKIYCVNCLFNLDKLQLNFKTISTTNFNSAGRNYGYNWITSSNITSLKLLTDKATHTINRIEDFNETIYDTNNKDNEDSEFEMSIKLDRGLISFIKDYNKQAEGKGGYLNNSLKCVDYTDKDGKVYEKLFCKSELLDEIFENYSGNITVKGDRDDVNSYWTPWTKMDPNATFGGDVIGGPAWK